MVYTKIFQRCKQLLLFASEKQKKQTAVTAYFFSQHCLLRVMFQPLFCSARFKLDIRRQNLTSVDVRFWRLKSMSTLKE